MPDGIIRIYGIWEKRMRKLIVAACAASIATLGSTFAAYAADSQVQGPEFSAGGITSAAFVVGGFGPRFGGGIGFGLYNPWWAYPSPYAYPYRYSPPRHVVVVPPAPPPVYAAPAGPAPQNWYYCNNPQGYYPY